MRLVSGFSSLLALVSTAFALSSSLQQITANYNSVNPAGAGTPSNAGFYYYKPSQLAVPTPLIVAIHYCSGTAQAYFSGTQYASLADTHGYIVIYPNSPNSGTCWDVNSDQTLKHNGGSDSLAIVNMARYAIANWGIDATQVYVTGTSSGAMMTNVLIGAYPDVFYGGSAFSGVAFGCFGNHQPPDSWNSQCSTGELIQTPQQWGDEVRAAFPGYTGPRPKIQVWHGTVDTTLYPQNFYEEIKEWTNVFGYSQTPISNISGAPLPNGYSNATYGPLFQAILAQGVGHTVPERAPDVLTFFGLSGLTPGNHGTTSKSTTRTSPTTITSSTTSTTSATSTATTSSTTISSVLPSGGAAHWGQCGGLTWTGPTTCQSPYTCTELNAYYYQCL